MQLCREVFGESLNESRDPEHGGGDRYTSRYFLKHTILEQAFDSLSEANFNLVCSAATGANASGDQHSKQTDDDNKWFHYNEYVFIRNL